MLDAIIMADLHFGAVDPHLFMNELNKCLFNRLNHIKKLDMIIIAGDLFDMKEYATSDAFISVIHFINKLLLQTTNLGTKIVILKGTRTHDDYQLKTLETIYGTLARDDRDRVEFIHTVSSEEVNGVKFLYLPEEYVVDQDAYYEEWFNKHYDIIIGHGTIDSIWRSKKQKRNDISSAPVFNVDQLCSIGNYCYFGHEHMRKSYGKRDRFKYVGPMTVWEYDKPDAGYYFIHYSPENEQCREEYIENECAQKLIERTITVYDGMEMGEFMDIVDGFIDAPGYDGLKIKVSISSSCAIYVAVKNFVITKAGLYDNVKFVMNVVESEEETEEEKIEREKTEELHATIFSQNMSDETTIAEFIKSKNNKDISLDIIREICKIGEPIDG